MEIGFRHNNDTGLVSISFVPNEDPAAVGKGEEARGFPVCTARIEYPGQGYRTLFGWVQLVRSTDNESGGAAFEMDPLRFFEDSPAPYCWYGLTPTLFDAPSRDDHQPLDWIAHSFLAVTPRHAGVEKQVVPLLGFSWGFRIDARGRIEPEGPKRLQAADWIAHLDFLRSTYPTWQFPPPPDFD